VAYVRLNNDKRIHKAVKNLGQVQRGVEDAADDIAQKAETILSAHRRDGDARITVDHSGTDSTVYLDDERGYGAALSIEYGHTAANGEFVPGLYPLHKGAGLA
jgi:hypothetical protein